MNARTFAYLIPSPARRAAETAISSSPVIEIQCLSNNHISGTRGFRFLYPGGDYLALSSFSPFCIFVEEATCVIFPFFFFLIIFYLSGIEVWCFRSVFPLAFAAICPPGGGARTRAYREYLWTRGAIFILISYGYRDIGSRVISHENSKYPHTITQSAERIPQTNCWEAFAHSARISEFKSYIFQPAITREREREK